MSIYTNTTHTPLVSIARDADGEIMVVVEGPRGPINIEISAAEEASIEQTLEFGDKEEIEDLCEFVIGSLLGDLEKCFPGAQFSHFADAPDDNSEIATRERTAGDIRRARECIAYRDLLEAGLNEMEIQQLI